MSQQDSMLYSVLHIRGSLTLTLGVYSGIGGRNRNDVK